MTIADAIHNLTGTVLQNGWKILDLIIPSSTATGGNYSCGYIVELPDGERAFLKAFDFSEATNAPDPAVMLNVMTSAFLFERELLKRCRDRHLNRVVTAMSSGVIKEPTAPGGVIYYIVFERAEADVRQKIDAEQSFDLAWRLRALHHLATGLRQLHSMRIAHQDVKPSNLLHYLIEGSKLTDLGRAACEGLTPPHENDTIAGDPDYAPPELLYGVAGDWNERRLGCDLYLLGSMIVYFFTNLGITHMWMKHLNGTLHPVTYSGSYDAILPHMRDAFNRAITEFQGHVPDEQLRRELTVFVRELCDPDPSLRGHPAERGRYGNRFSLERYISRFNHLAARAELALR